MMLGARTWLTVESEVSPHLECVEGVGHSCHLTRCPSRPTEDLKLTRQSPDSIAEWLVQGVEPIREHTLSDEQSGLCSICFVMVSKPTLSGEGNAMLSLEGC